jgi:hypothetical protein
MSPNVLGIDSGLAKLGVARIDQDGRVDAWPGSSDALPDGADPAEQAARCRGVIRWAVGRADVNTVLAMVEELPRTTEYGGHDERAHILWSIVDQLSRHGVLVALVNPKTMKSRIAGNGNASKAEVRSAINRIWPGQGLLRISDDASDGVGLATLGVARLHAIHGEPWPRKWLDARSLNLEDGFQWPRELRTAPKTKQLPMYEVFSR